MNNILDLLIEHPFSSGEITLKEYFKLLLLTLWEEDEGFRGKKPFGNSGWKWDVIHVLAKAKLVKGDATQYSDGDIEFNNVDYKAGEKLIKQAIKEIFNETPSSQS